MGDGLQVAIPVCGAGVAPPGWVLFPPPLFGVVGGHRPGFVGVVLGRSSFPLLVFLLCPPLVSGFPFPPVAASAAPGGFG